MMQRWSSPLQRGSHGASVALSLPTWPHPGSQPGQLHACGSPCSILLSSAEGSWDNGWRDQESWWGAKISLPPVQGAWRGKAQPALAFLFPSPPTPPCSLRGLQPREQCLQLCAGCKSQPPDLRMLLPESWKWFRQWLGPFITGQRGQSRENKSDLASCTEVDPLFGIGHVLCSSPAWESCKAIESRG